MKLASESPSAKGAWAAPRSARIAVLTPLKESVPNWLKMANRPTQEGEVADPVDDEGLAPGLGREVLIEVEADQQVGAEADALPADEHHEVVVAEDQEQHGAHEEVQVGEISPVTLLVGHVADRVDVDQEADEGDHEEHDGRERVEQEGDVDRERAGGPGVEQLLERRVARAGEELGQAGERDEEREAGSADADRGRQRLRGDS